MKAGTAYRPEIKIIGWSGKTEEAVESDDPFDRLT